jgi:hypothetical protein
VITRDERISSASEIQAQAIHWIPVVRVAIDRQPGLVGIDPINADDPGTVAPSGEIVRQPFRVTLDTTDVPRRKVRRDEQNLHRKASIIDGRAKDGGGASK